MGIKILDKIEELFKKWRNSFSSFSIGGCHGNQAKEMVIWQLAQVIAKMLLYTFFLLYK